MHFTLPYCLSSHMVTAQPHIHPGDMLVGGGYELDLDSGGVSFKMPCYSHIHDRRQREKNIMSIQGEALEGSEAAYYVVPHIHALLGPRLSVLLLWAHTGTLCDAAELSVQRAWR